MTGREDGPTSLISCRSFDAQALPRLEDDDSDLGLARLQRSPSSGSPRSPEKPAERKKDA